MCNEETDFELPEKGGTLVCDVAGEAKTHRFHHASFTNNKAKDMETTWEAKVHGKSA